MDPAYVPIILADLEPRKVRNLWTDEASYQAGYDGIVKQQEALLMGAVDRIISEVRAVREGDATLLEFQDPTLDPYTLPLVSLATLQDQVFISGQDAVDKLEEIRLILEAQGEGEGGQLEALLQIVALLSV